MLVPGNQKALRLDGQAALQLSDRSLDLGPWKAFTLSAWFKITNDASQRRVAPADGVLQAGTIVRLSSWSPALRYRDGELPNVAGISVTSSGHVSAEWCNTMGGSLETQRLELPQMVNDGRFHHLALVRRPGQDPKVMLIGLVLDGQHATWVRDASDGLPVAFNQGTKSAWSIQNTVGGRAQRAEWVSRSHR